MNRKQALKTMAAGAGSALALPALASTMKTSQPLSLKENINHSVCQWCYSGIPLEDLAKAAKEMGLTSVELLGPDDWAIVQKYGLTCAMAYVTRIAAGDGHVRPLTVVRLTAITPLTQMMATAAI